MEQMKMDGLEEVAIDYDSPTLPASVKEFRPAVYRDGNAFCCVLGPDPQAGIFGCGESTQLALSDWDKHLKERLETHAEDDPVANYVRDTIAAADWVIW